MASRYNRTQIAQAPVAALAATMLRFDRNTLAGFVEVAVAILDCSDGDPDAELNGDETDHQHSEDCFVEHPLTAENVGCPIADPGGCEHDGCEQDEWRIRQYGIDQTAEEKIPSWLITRKPKDS